MKDELIIKIDKTIQLDSTVWSALVKFLANWCCEECGIACTKSGASGSWLDAHHIDGNDRNNCLSNGQALCRSCHSRVTHEGRKKPLASAGNYSKASKKKWDNPELRAKQVAGMAESYKKMSAEARSERVRKGWETRKAKAAEFV